MSEYKNIREISAETETVAWSIFKKQTPLVEQLDLNQVTRHTELLKKIRFCNYSRTTLSMTCFTWLP
jgi:hypothetical protein